VALFTPATIHESLFTTGTVHKTVFGFLIFVARVRARADNVFKGKVNNKRNSREYDQLY
jgi:hypothetical protein